MSKHSGYRALRVKETRLATPVKMTGGFDSLRATNLTYHNGSVFGGQVMYDFNIEGVKITHKVPFSMAKTFLSGPLFHDHTQRLLSCDK